MDKQTSLAVQNLSFTYTDGTAALKDISFDVPKGEKVALVGPNGAGKSTLLLHFNGILSSKANVVVSGLTLNKETLNTIRRKVGVVFQDPNEQLFCPTIFDDVAFGPLHFGLPKHEIKGLVKKSLADVDLTGFETKSGHHLSLGERKRAAMAAVMACRPDILLLDEPTANLDPKRRREMIYMINAWNYTTIIATHDLDLAWDTCSRCMIINSGQIVADGSREEILQNETLLHENGLELPLKFQN